MRRPLLCALLALCAAAPARADETIAQLADPTPVDAWGGRLVWSERAAGTERYRLMTRLGDGPAEAGPVRAHRGPFAADLGPGPGGGMLAAYARAGDLYAYDFATGRERRLGRQSTGARERLPSVWHERVAFVRRVRGHARLYVQPLAGGAAREVRGGRGAYEQIDLRGARVAFVRSRQAGDRHEYQLLVGRGGRVARLVDRAASGLLSSVAILKPAFADGALVYAVSRLAAAGNRFLRYDLGTRRTREAISHRGLLAAAFDGGRFLYVQTTIEDRSAGCRATADDPSTCTLARTDPVSFR